MKPPFLPFTGHDLLAVERFRDDTRHMIEFRVLSEDSPYGQREQYVRLFLDEDRYAQVFKAHQSGSIRILRHAHIIEGHILPDKPKKRRGRSF